jgi:hypothetical protein
MGSYFSCLRRESLDLKYDIQKIKNQFPIINDVYTFTSYINFCKNNDHSKYIKEHLILKNYINTNNDTLTLTTTPFNVFARFASKTTKNNTDQSMITDQNNWMVCNNLVINDLNWYNSDYKAASMAGPDRFGKQGHVFITTKNMHWSMFNVTSIALQKDGLSFLEELKIVAEKYTKARGWVNSGYYFHCFPHNSVNSLHLHVINLDTVGFNYYENGYKNMPLDDVITSLKTIINCQHL